MPNKLLGLKENQKARQNVLTTFKQREKTRSLRTHHQQPSMRDFGQPSSGAGQHPDGQFQEYGTAAHGDSAGKEAQLPSMIGNAGFSRKEHRQRNQIKTVRQTLRSLKADDPRTGAGGEKVVKQQSGTARQGQLLPLRNYWHN